MSPEPKSFPAIPQETYAAARRIYGQQHIYLRIGDQLEKMYPRIKMTLLDPSSQFSAETVFRLALITAFQYAEWIPDPIAADALMKRLDWKYALSLPMMILGVSSKTLCQFRLGLISSENSLREYTRMLHLLSSLGLYDETKSSQLNSTLVIQSICEVTRLFLIKQAMKNALSRLSAAAPDWMRANALPHWYERYKTGRLASPSTTSRADMQEEADRIGKDLLYLLDTLEKQNLSDLLNQKEVQDIKRLLKEEFNHSSSPMHLRSPICANCVCNTLGSTRSDYSL